MSTDLRAEFHLGSRSLPLVDLAATIPAARLRLDEVLQTAVDRVVLLCWIEGDDDATVTNALDADASIVDWTVLEATGRRRLYRLRMSGDANGPIAIDAPFVEQGVTPIDATITAEGWRVRARFPDRTTIAAYRRDCERRGRSFELEALYEPTTARADAGSAVADLTTPKQREALIAAYESGYYDLPRGTTLAGLGNQLGIARRSVSDRLRRAERAVLGAVLENERLAYRDRGER